jgi:periplasmic copper chaperone A
MKTRLFVLFVGLALIVSACASAATPATPQAGIEVTNAVILVDAGAMGGMDMGQSYAGYLTIKNGTTTDDQLLSVGCDFASAMLHKTSMNGDVASMKEISSVDLPTGGTVEFKSGGLHIMFMGLKRDLKVGETVNLTLKFKNAGDVTVTATVTAR